MWPPLLSEQPLGQSFYKAQKSFLPYEGCFEHHLVYRMHRKPKRRYTGMARLENAFRSVPTEHLIGDIFCKCGVKQGCPRSPILFDLAFKQLVRAVDDGKCGYNFDQWKVSILEYADNLF